MLQWGNGEAAALRMNIFVCNTPCLHLHFGVQFGHFTRVVSDGPVNVLWAVKKWSIYKWKCAAAAQRELWCLFWAARVMFNKHLAFRRAAAAHQWCLTAYLPLLHRFNAAFCSFSPPDACRCAHMERVCLRVTASTLWMFVSKPYLCEVMVTGKKCTLLGITQRWALCIWLIYRSLWENINYVLLGCFPLKY